LEGRNDAAGLHQGWNDILNGRDGHSFGFGK
jgi:hypothetical protein